MMIKGTSMMLFAGGVMLWVFTKMIPLLQLMMMDLVAICMMIGSVIILFFCLSISGVGLQFDTIPPGSAIINYIRRDGLIVPQLGRRIFSGESFLDVPKLGLIEDLGKDTVFTWGRKRVRFGLENINYTPNPKHMNMCKDLYDLGFDDSDDLTAVLNIQSMDPVRDRKLKAYYLERMAYIYWNMIHDTPKGVGHLMDIFKKAKSKTVFGKKRYEYKETASEVKKESKTNDTTVAEMNEWLRSRK